jgi:hypothetical protein
VNEMNTTTITKFEKRVNNMAAEFTEHNGTLLGDHIVLRIGGSREGLTRAEFMDLCSVLFTVLETVKGLK